MLFRLLSLVTFSAIAVHLIPAPIARGEENLLGLPPQTMENRGALVICGGGRLPESVYQQFVDLAGGKKARVVLIPSAWPFASLDDAKRRNSGWSDYDLASLDYIDAKTRDEADDEKFVAPLKEATGVWITGGRQGRLASLYSGTKTEAAIKEVLARGGAIGGTSAGAAIMSQVMIRYGAARNLMVERGFGLLTQAVVDQHFTERKREPRLLSVLEKHPEKLGLGVDEGTALVVQGNRLRVVGRSQVTVCIPQAPGEKPLLHKMDADKQFDLIQTSAAKGARPAISLRGL
ncbi:MAG: cyanophycinase [Pirellulales bacterium]